MVSSLQSLLLLFSEILLVLKWRECRRLKNKEDTGKDSNRTPKNTKRLKESTVNTEHSWLRRVIMKLHNRCRLAIFFMSMYMAWIRKRKPILTCVKLWHLSKKTVKLKLCSYGLLVMMQWRSELINMIWVMSAMKIL